VTEYEQEGYAAIKVVGIRSLGTFCWVLLFMANEGDPLFIQVKEARTSVLEPYAGASEFPNHSQRVVNGYRLMQPASDMFLGWAVGEGGRYCYFRQLRDIKVSARVESFGATEMNIYSTWCGRALALSHARSTGSAAMLSGYMGKVMCSMAQSLRLRLLTPIKARRIILRSPWQFARGR